MQMDFAESIRTEGAQGTILGIRKSPAPNKSIAIAEDYERDTSDADSIAAASPSIADEISTSDFRGHI